MKEKKQSYNNRYLLKLAFQRRFWIMPGIILACQILVGQKAFAESWLTAQIFNQLQQIVAKAAISVSLKTIILFCVLILGTYILAWIFRTISDMAENCWREHINVIIQEHFLLKDYKMNMSDFDDLDFQNRRSVAKRVDPIGEIKMVITAVSIISVTVSFSIVLWQYRPIMVLIALVVKLPLFYFMIKADNENRKFQIDTDIINREKSYYRNIPVNRVFAKEYKLFDMKDFVCEKYCWAVNRYHKKFKKRYVKESTNNVVQDLYDDLIMIIVYIVIGISVFKGNMLFGTYTLIVAAFKNLSNSAESLVKLASKFKDVYEQNKMLSEYMDGKTIYDKGEACGRKVTDGLHTIEFRKVSFSYPGTDNKILDNLDMTIEGGKIYALVGLNGCGKSTLVNLILRLYRPDSGEIVLDGVNIEEYNIKSYYDAIACVFQCTTKYAMRISDYIAVGKTCDRKRAQKALEYVNLSGWCEQLKYGMETMLTRVFSSEADSTEPSLGQWQKLSIARAIYKDAPIMILDEPSASLDVDTENEIFNCIVGLALKKTTILISHRLSNIMECDHVLLLQNGKLMEQGTHQKLMELNGIYAELFKKQAECYSSM